MLKNSVHNTEASGSWKWIFKPLF